MPDTAPVTIVPTAGFAPIVPSPGPTASAAPQPYPTAPQQTAPQQTYPTAYPAAMTFPPMTSAYPTTSYPGSAHPASTNPGATFLGPTSTPATAPDRSRTARALGIGSLALGVFAALGAALPVVNLASIGLAATGTGLGIAALFHLSRSRGIALAGAIVSVVALTTSVALATVYTGVATSAASGLVDGLGTLPAVVDDYAEETITTADPDGPSGTIDDPLPLGETIVVTRDGQPRWEITVADPTYDAEEEVLRGSGASDVSADLAGDAAQFAYIAAEITYLGDASASLYEEVYVCFSTADEVFSCAGELLSVAPGTDLSLADEIESGDTVTGNFLVAIPAAAEDDGRWAVAGEWTDFLYLATT